MGRGRRSPSPQPIISSAAAIRAPLEPPGLFRWRQASEACHAACQHTFGRFAGYLAQGGPEVVQAHKARAAKLEVQVRQLKGSKEVQRYRALQLDLKERDRISDVLRKLLLTSQGRIWTKQDLDAEVDKASGLVNMKKDTSTGGILEEDMYLYGASRELLLRENKQLRRVLEQRLITVRTAWPHQLNGQPVQEAGAEQPGASNTLDAIPDSPLKSLLQVPDASPVGDQGVSAAQARGNRPTAAKTPTKSQQATLALKAGVHMAALKELQEAGEELVAAARSYRLPCVSHAEVQVDDGSAGMQRMLQDQVSLLAGQKAQLINKVSELESAVRLGEQQQQAVKKQAAAIRDAHNQLLSNQDTLSLDVRAHLASESSRADAAERALDESRAEAKRLLHLNNDLNQQLVEVNSQARVLQRAVEEKTQQVVSLTSLYQQLKSEIDQLSGSLVTSHDNVSGRVLQALQALHAEHTKSLTQLTGAASKTQATVGALETAHKELRSVTATARDTAVKALEVLEQQLLAAHARAAAADKERHQTAKQLIAGQLLKRLQDRRHVEALQHLRSELPDALAARLLDARGGQPVQPPPGTQDALDHSLHETGAHPYQDELQVHDMMDDSTCAVLQQSKQLRAQLSALIVIDGISPPTCAASHPPAEASQPTWLSRGLGQGQPKLPTTSMQGLKANPLFPPPLPEPTLCASTASPTKRQPDPAEAVAQQPVPLGMSNPAQVLHTAQHPSTPSLTQLTPRPEPSASPDTQAKVQHRGLQPPQPALPPTNIPIGVASVTQGTEPQEPPPPPWQKGLRAQLSHMMASPARRAVPSGDLGCMPGPAAGSAVLPIRTDEASQAAALDFHSRVAFPVAATPPTSAPDTMH